MSPKNESIQFDTLVETLRIRFAKNKAYHPSLIWEKVQGKVHSNPHILKVLEMMENTGGEPDVVEFEIGSHEIIFCDCSEESPKGRRSLCYDSEARIARKEHPPKSSAVEMAKEIGIELLDDDKYKKLQSLGNFDLKTSSWLKTPANIREKGGAIFGDKRYGEVFVYHNGADSYYAARGFRGLLKI